MRSPPIAATNTRSKRRAARPLEALSPDHLERISLVCHYFICGHKPGHIPQVMWKEHKIKISRETSYRYLNYAATHGWLRFHAPTAQSLRDRLRTSHPWLASLEVVHTGHFEHVAWRAAERLLDLIVEHAARTGRDKVHVGFSGGYSMRAVAERLADLLCESRKGLPEEIEFHVMVAGFDVHDTTTDPNTFLTYMDDPDIKVKTHVHCLHAPPIVHNDTFESLKKLEGIVQSFEAADQIDIIATSVGNWSLPCRDGMLRKYLKDSTRSREILDAAGCRGDMLWRPFNKHGPINEETPLRAMTLIELSQIPQLIRGGKSVMVVLGPCRVCQEPRGEILATLLDLEEHLLTDLVVDSRSVKAMLGRA